MCVYRRRGHGPPEWGELLLVVLGQAGGGLGSDPVGQAEGGLGPDPGPRGRPGLVPPPGLHFPAAAGFEKLTQASRKYIHSPCQKCKQYGSVNPAAPRLGFGV